MLSNITVRGWPAGALIETAVNIFSCNSALRGGAIYLDRTTAVKSALTFQNSALLFSGNIACRLGGAIY